MNMELEMIIEKACWERGCACYDYRVDEGVEVTRTMACPNCERYKESARNWRHKAYELSGRPLPWEGGDTWVGLTPEDKRMAGIPLHTNQISISDAFDVIERILKEKNT